MHEVSEILVKNRTNNNRQQAVIKRHSLTRVKLIALYKQLDKIQTQKGSNESLIFLTRTHSIQIVGGGGGGEFLLSSHKTTLKQQINGQKR